MLSSDEERRKAAGPDPAARAAVERDIQRSSDKKAAGGAFFLVALDLCPTHLPRLVVLNVFACPDGHHWRPVPQLPYVLPYVLPQLQSQLTPPLLRRFSPHTSHREEISSRGIRVRCGGAHKRLAKVEPADSLQQRDCHGVQHHD